MQRSALLLARLGEKAIHPFVKFETTIRRMSMEEKIRFHRLGSSVVADSRTNTHEPDPLSTVVLEATLQGGRQMKMKIREAMTQKVRIASPDQSIADAARMMAECDAGALPVGEDDRLVGVITDRDIAVRAVALGRSPETPVREVMSKEVLYCFEDEDVEHVARNMSDLKVRRLPVLNRKKRLVGIVSIGDLSQTTNADVTGRAVAGVSKPGGAHSQSLH